MDLLLQIFENLILFSPFYIFYGMGTGSNTGKLLFRDIGRTGSGATAGLSITETNTSIIISSTGSGISSIATCEIAYGTSLNNNITSNLFCAITTPNIKAIIGARQIVQGSPTNGTSGTSLILSGKNNSTSCQSYKNVIVGGATNLLLQGQCSVIIGGCLNTLESGVSTTIINSRNSESLSSQSTIINSIDVCMKGAVSNAIIGSAFNVCIDSGSQYSQIISSCKHTCLDAPRFSTAISSYCSCISRCDKNYNCYQSILSSQESLIFGREATSTSKYASPTNYSNIISSRSSTLKNSESSNIISSKNSKIISDQYFLMPYYFQSMCNSVIMSSFDSCIISCSTYNQLTNLQSRDNVIIGSTSSCIKMTQTSNNMVPVKNVIISSRCSEILNYGKPGDDSIVIISSNETEFRCCMQYSVALASCEFKGYRNVLSAVISDCKSRIFTDADSYTFYDTLISTEGSGICDARNAAIIASNNSVLYGSYKSTSTILGGSNAKSYGDNSHIIGGVGNKVFNNNINIGGHNNYNNGANNTIIGGYTHCIISGSFNALLGGLCNRIQGAYRSTIIGGAFNCIISPAQNAVIIGGNGLVNKYVNTTMVFNLMFNSTAVDGANFGGQGRLCLNTTTGVIKIRKGLVTNT